MDIEKIVSQMTLEEKVAMCSGADFWHLKAVERLGVPQVMVSDGPHGLRKQDQQGDHLGINDSIQAVCFPSAAATACSFDRELMFRLGQALGEECQAEDVAVLLGPAANIKRSPLCGRNFEYFSEDPYLSSQMAARHIQGVQSKNVGTSLKHFAANNQEHRRMTVDARVDERTLREIYLASFEGAVKQGKPWTVMCSYNQINGVYSSENPKTLTQILRDEWGFDGYTMTDWGAANDRVQGIAAGLELEMPGSGGSQDAAILEAVRSGRLEERVLDRAVTRILAVTKRYLENRDGQAAFDRAAHHQLARELAAECMVLLKNEGVLPLSAGKRIAFIGKFAKEPRYQGGGSSHINAYQVTGALEAVESYAQVSYAQGYDTRVDELDPELLHEAVSAASQAEVAVVFAGLPDAFESEGYDRKHMRLPDCQNRLIEEVLKVQPNVVVVLHNGSPVEMPWVDRVKGILEVYLGGEAVGDATVDVLFGEVNPSGKLAETFPRKLADNPSYFNFPGDGDRVEYREGLYVGYRYYDKKQMEVLFPFGHGLSYTRFKYRTIKLDKQEMRDTDQLKVTVRLCNAGAVIGKEAIQVYVASAHEGISRPEKELKEFLKVELWPGEERDVSFTLDRRAFAYYNTDLGDWYVEEGDYDILIGRSSRDIALRARVTVHATQALPVHFTIHSTMGDVMSHPAGAAMVREMMGKMSLLPPDAGDKALGEGTGEMMAAMMRDMPIRSVLAFAGGRVPAGTVEDFIERLNEEANRN